MRVRSKKTDIVRDATKAASFMEKYLDGERKRAVKYAGKLEEENAALRRENEKLKNLIESLRWRVFTLLKSTDVDAEIFGLPRYTISGEDRCLDCDEIFREGELEELQKRYNVLDITLDKAKLGKGKYVCEEEYGL